MAARCRVSLFFNEQMKSIQRECKGQQQCLQCWYHDDSECKSKRRRNRPGRGRSQCKRSCQLLSSRCACRSRTIASAGSIIAVIAASASNHAHAFSLIDAARATGNPSTRGRSRCTAGDAETGACAASTILRSFTTGTCTSPLNATPCLGHASIDASGSLSDDSNSNNHGTGTPRRMINYFVVGTSHFRCNSADEVERIIREIGPDGVVVELDPERVIRLTKEGSKHPDEEQLFGADFLSAIDTAKDMDVPLFIGDEYSKETRARFVQTAFDMQSYSPSKLFSAFTSSFLPMERPGGRGSYINVPRAFISDPKKAAPLITTATPAFVLFLLTMQTYQIEDVGNDLATAFSLLFSFLATCKVFNNFISDRDEILASNAMRAAEVVSSLKSKETIRARWTFTVNGNDAKVVGTCTGFGDKREDSGTQISRNIPLFTLKTPLLEGRIRNLNLFEPRWLKMIDDVISHEENDCKRSFGCVTCTNKFYSAIQIDGKEGRYADVVFRRKGMMANMIQLVEGTRPVSGDRKVNVQIEGEEPFLVNEDELSISREGYLIASNVHNGDNISSEDECVDYTENLNCDEDINIVVVVGLLHANGVIDRLAVASA